MVAAALRLAGIDPSRLVLELTETAALDDLDRIAAALQEIRNMGVGWAIDDFGTGYCSLTYLSRLPVDTVKIDKSFVQSTAAADDSIVGAIIAMAHGLGMTVIAEGVELPEQLSGLAARGCDLVQGFLLGRPVPADEFEALVRAQAAQAYSEPPSRAAIPRAVPRAEPSPSATPARSMIRTG
jgi:EAL domain-containing protein (putative c-di-GMP-specific phosphodiesterase class I)